MRAIGALWVLLTLLVAESASAQPSAGDILVTDRDLLMVFSVDPSNGDRTDLSSSSTGSGTNFFFPNAIEVDTAGNIFVADRDQLALVAVDGATGDRTTVSNAAVGSGVWFKAPVDLALESNGDILVLDGSFGDMDALFRVSPDDGDRTIISVEDHTPDCVAVNSPFFCCTGPGTSDGTPPCAQVGTGPTFDLPQSVAVESNGDILVVDGALDAVFRVDPTTGDRSIVSSPGVGSGTAFDDPFGMTVEADGNILVTDFVDAGVFRVDPTTGNRTIVSITDRTFACNGVGSPFACCTGSGTGNGTPPCADVGSGTEFFSPFHIALELDGDIVLDASIFDGGLVSAVVRVDPSSGDRTVVSSPSTGSGSDFDVLLGIAVVPQLVIPVPLLSAPGIALLGFVIMVAGGLIAAKRQPDSGSSGPRGRK